MLCHILKKIILGILLNAGALYVVTETLDTISYTGGWKFFLIAGVIIGLLNTFVKPILKLISLPFIIVSAGLFLIVINTGIFWVTQITLEKLAIRDVSLSVTGPISYVVAAVIFGLVNWFEHIFVRNK